jgi:hypothetical protein
VSNEARNGVMILHGNTQPTPSAHRNGLFRPTTALEMPPVGVPASPWLWAKARSERGALIGLCGDGVVSNDARNEDGNTQPNSSAHRNGLFRPTTALEIPPVGVPASPWLWAKARSELCALMGLVRKRSGVE